MELKKSTRSLAKIRAGLQGTSGSGKTYSSLLLAHGLVKDWGKVAIIDTENKSAHLYSHLGEYKVLDLSPPFTPERYIQAINVCENSGVEVIIIDSISHEWEGEGGILETHASMPGNSFTSWSKLTPRHNLLIQKILSSDCHIIATVRSKQDYVLTDKNGKQVPEKVGMKGIQRDGLEYDFTVFFEIDIYNNATCSKDRTQLFKSNIPFKINEETGEQILKWCNAGEISIHAFDITKRIKECKSLEELTQLYKSSAEVRQYDKELNDKANELRNFVNFSENGTNK